MALRNSRTTRSLLAVFLTGVAISAITINVVADFRQRPSSTGTDDNQSVPQARSTTRDRFQEYYDLGWRADGQAGNTLVEVVYYFPALRQSLSDYKERSFIQAQTWQAIEQRPGDDLLSFVFQLERNVEIDPGIDLLARLQLRDENGRSYGVEHWQAFSLPNLTTRHLYGIVFFRRPDTVSAKQLTLTIAGLPGNTRSTVFTWSDEILRRAEDTLPSVESS